MVNTVKAGMRIKNTSGKVLVGRDLVTGLLFVLDSREIVRVSGIQTPEEAEKWRADWQHSEDIEDECGGCDNGECCGCCDCCR